jgi:hypothetical protein
MSRRKNGVRREWRNKLTELNLLNKKLKKNPEDATILSKISSVKQRIIMPKSK